MVFSPNLLTCPLLLRLAPYLMASTHGRIDEPVARPWAEAFLQAGAEHAAVLEPLAAAIGLYTRAKHEADSLRSEVQALRTQNDALRAELTAASSAAAATQPAAVTKLQTKLLELQDAVSEHYRTQAENAKQRLQLSEINQRLKEEHAQMSARLATAQAAAGSAAEERDRVRAALHERESHLSTAAEELVRVRRLLEAKAHESDARAREIADLAAERARLEAWSTETIKALDREKRDKERISVQLSGAQARVLELSRVLQQQQAALSASTLRLAADTVAAVGESAPLSGSGPGAGTATGVGPHHHGDVDPSGSRHAHAAPAGLALPANAGEGVVAWHSEAGASPAAATSAAAGRTQSVAPPPTPGAAGSAGGGAGAGAGGGSASGGGGSASGLLSWLGNRVSAVVSAAKSGAMGPGQFQGQGQAQGPGSGSASGPGGFGTPTTGSGGLGGFGASSGTPRSAIGPAGALGGGGGESAMPSPGSSGSTTAHPHGGPGGLPGLGLLGAGGGAASVFMTSSVTAALADYVFAALPVPSTPSVVIRAHSTEVNAVRIHDSGSVVASGASDGNVALWNMHGGSRAGILYTSTEGNAVLSIDAYGSVLAAGCTDRTVRIFDLPTQRVVRSLTGHAGKVQSLLYVPPSPATSAVASGAGAAASGGSSGGFTRGLLFSGSGDRTVKLWDLRDGRAVRTIDSRSIVNGMALSPDGMLLAVANQDGGVRLWDIRMLASGRMAENTSAHSAAVTSVAFSRHDGGTRLLTAARDNTLRLLDGRTLDPLMHLLPPTPSPGLATQAGPAGGSAGSAGGTGGSGGDVMRRSISSTAGGAAAGSPVTGPGLSAADALVGAAAGSSGLAGSTGLAGSGRSRAPSGLGSSGFGSGSIVMRAPGFRVPVNWSRALLSPNGQWAVCGSDRGTIFSWSADTGSVELEIGAGGEGGAGGRGGSGGGGGHGRTRSAGGGGGSFSAGDADLGPHDGSPVFALDYCGSAMVTGDDKGRVVIWADG